MHQARDLTVLCWVSWGGVVPWLLCLTDTEKDVGGWLYNEVNLYPHKKCQFLAGHSIKLPEELTYLITDLDQCMAGGWQGWVLRFLGLDISELQVKFFMLSVFDVNKELHMISEVKIGPIMLKIFGTWFFEIEN